MRARQAKPIKRMHGFVGAGVRDWRSTTQLASFILQPRALLLMGGHGESEVPGSEQEPALKIPGCLRKSPSLVPILHAIPHSTTQRP